MLSTFVRIWKTENTLEQIGSAPIDLIVPLSFTSLPGTLTIGTGMSLERALGYHINYFPSASVAFSSCSYVFPGAEKVEDALRTETCRQAGIEPIVAKSMVSTVDEAVNIQEALDARGIHPKCILIVTGELHSRSARYIWQKLFPGSQILITCISYQLEIQPNHPVLDQRQMWRWVLSNIKREIALRCLPLGWIRKMQHKQGT